ncbi:sugar ABC transporter substrate-binding protein [Pelomonas sp. KK5]|uniref:sugar ABC transporter substrate-binding protein n=1 Tax=Pelomonas sp. KK5 TaxID=1855730 RepID=UPI0018E92D03|nr:sugar ABC transporter substrate-binding protein [Pelomonas sp. KK5]
MTIRRREALLAGTAALAGCGRSGTEPLRFWAMGREGEVVEDLLEDFRREQPGIEVRIEQLPWTAAHEKLLTAFAGDATPDIAQLGNTWVAELAALDALSPLDEFVAGSRTVDMTDYFDGIWSTNVIGGKLLGLPWYVDTRLLFYRRDLLAKVGFDAPPRDWAEWTAQMRRLAAGPVKQPLILPNNEFEPLLALALQQGEPLLKDANTRGNFSGAGFRRALGFCLELLGSGLAPIESNQQIANVWQEFGKGTFAYYISGPWNIGEFKRRLPPELKDAWSTAPLPGPNGPGASTAGGSSLVLFKRSRRRPEAFKLIEFLSRPEVQARFYALTGDLPPRKSAWAALDADARTRAFAAQLERVRPTPPVPEWERIANEMQLFAARAAAEGQSVDATVQALDEDVDRILAKRRWLHERGRA